MKWILPTFALCLFLMACGDKKAEETATQETAAQDEAPAKYATEENPADGSCGHKRGPYGGLLVIMGNNEGHLEVAPNHAGGAVTIVSYDMEMIEVPMDKPPVLNFKSVDGPKQLIGEGEDSEWIFFDESLKKAFKKLRFRVVIDGKTYNPVWDHIHPPK
ncbi:MAG: hypothetical protein ACYSX0_12835 [Planctomycetota bacterium]|jgi:hypothetical protein